MASAVREVDIPFENEDRLRPEALPGLDQARYRPRFRVVTRRSLRTVSSVQVSPTHRAWLFAAFPVLCLLVYVLFWTMAMRGGYYRAQLEEQIHTLRIEQAELEAEKRRLQSPGYILDRAARELGMQRAGQTEFAETPTAQQVAADGGRAGGELDQRLPAPVTQ